MKIKLLGLAFLTLTQTVNASDVNKWQEISYTLPTQRASGKALEISEIKAVRVYNELDGVREFIKDVPPEFTYTALDGLYFGCIRLATVDTDGAEGVMSELDKSKHCFDLPLSPDNLKVRITWEINTDG